METYKRNSDAVRTPVWFVLQDGLVYIVTRQGTGKVKRLKNNQRVRIAACTIKGAVTGQWHPGTASRLPDSESKEILKLRDKKYGFMAKLAKFASMGKGAYVAYSIKREPGPG